MDFTPLAGVAERQPQATDSTNSDTALRGAGTAEAAVAAVAAASSTAITINARRDMEIPSIDAALIAPDHGSLQAHLRHNVNGATVPPHTDSRFVNEFRPP